MANPGGKQTMLGQWRLALRQAEEAARGGRLDEALAFAARPEVADHRQAVRLRSKVVDELIGRAARRAAADDTDGAIADLALAEAHGAVPDVLAAGRLALAERVAPEVRRSLEAGDPLRVVERVEALAARQVSGPTLRTLREAAEAWKKGLEDQRRGEFGLAAEALERAGRLVEPSVKPALDDARRELDARRKEAHPRVERLYVALGGGSAGELLAAAESLLELLPDHPAARQARSRAWQQIGATSPGASLAGRAVHAPGPNGDGIVFVGDQRGAVAPPRPGTPRRAEPVMFIGADAPANARTPGNGERSILWADDIGAYLVCMDEQVSIGRAGPDASADVQVLGDLSRRHATITRSGDGYILRPLGPTYVNGKSVQAASLRDGDVIRLGGSVELEFRQPSPVSATARLRVVSRHRLPIAVDGVILMAETCIVGPSPQAHVHAPRLETPVVLYRQGPTLWCRAAGTFEVDGRPCLARSALRPGSRVAGEGFSFSLEPLGAGRPPIV